MFHLILEFCYIETLLILLPRSYTGPTHSQVGATYGISGKNRSIRSCNPESLLKHSLKRFVTVSTKYNKIEVYCTSIRFHNRSFGSIIDPKTCPYEVKNFFSLHSHDRISISVTKYTEKQKQKHLRYILYLTGTRKLNGVFPILTLKVDHLGSFVIKPIFLTYVFTWAYLKLK